VLVNAFSGLRFAEEVFHSLSHVFWQRLPFLDPLPQGSRQPSPFNAYFTNGTQESVVEVDRICLQAFNQGLRKFPWCDGFAKSLLGKCVGSVAFLMGFDSRRYRLPSILRPNLLTNQI